MKIKIAECFSATPGGRDAASGNFSAEEFRDKILIPKFDEAVNKGEQLYVDLDGVAGIAGSFLDEAFGGMIRKGISVESIRRNLVLISKETPEYAEMAIECMKDAAYRVNQGGFTHRVMISDVGPIRWN